MWKQLLKWINKTKERYSVKADLACSHVDI